MKIKTKKASLNDWSMLLREVMLKYVKKDRRSIENKNIKTYVA